MSRPDEVAAFCRAGPTRSKVALDQLLKARATTGPYRVVAGDVLELGMELASGPAAGAPGKAEPAKPPTNPPAQTGPYRVAGGDVLAHDMPDVLRAVGGALAEKAAPYACRVSDAGTISLPAVGKIPVAGKTLAEVDEAVIAAYHPRHIRARPSVVTRIEEHRTFSVSVTGAVRTPGKFPLRNDELTLVSALMRAGGIVKEGANVLRIHRAGQAKPLVIPIGGRDVPAADVALKEGDVVEVTPGLFSAGRYQCRVTRAGAIHLPVVGGIPVAGKTLAEIEGLAAEAYYPKYVASRPIVVAKVAEYRSATVSVVGGVGKPGRYELRSNELSLVSLLMKAGGVAAGGAGLVRVRRAGQPDDAQPIVVPVKEANIPLVDLALKDGDTIEVERLAPQVFTVTGLVGRQGAFPYPPEAQYTLHQALAFAGGVDPLADPRYATVHRRAEGGKVASATLNIGPHAIVTAPQITIKPGDVIRVEKTFRTGWRTFFGKVFRFGVYANYPIGE